MAYTEVVDLALAMRNRGAPEFVKCSPSETYEAFKLALTGFRVEAQRFSGVSDEILEARAQKWPRKDDNGAE